MPIGDGLDATAAGMAVVIGSSTQAHDIDLELTKTRDYLANGPQYWKPGQTLSTARIADAAITAAKIADAAVTPTKLDRKYVEQGGSDSGDIAIAHGSGRAQLFAGGVFKGFIAYTSDLGGGGYLALTGGTMTGHLYSPPARSTPVNTSYVAAYLNGDGRLGATPSALKYKRDIAPYEGSVLDLEAVTYILKDDEKETRRLGIVADDANDVEPMLVVHEEGEVESFKYELLAVGLLKEVQRLAARVEQLEQERAS